MSKDSEDVRRKYRISREYGVNPNGYGQLIFDPPPEYYGENVIAVSCLHLHFGLDFPVHPFICELLRAVNIPLSHLTPNSLYTIYGFLKFCDEENYEPTILLFFAICKIQQRKDSWAYSFHARSGCKFIINLRDTHKYWSHQFVWITPPRNTNWEFPRTFAGPDFVRFSSDLPMVSESERRQLQGKILLRKWTVNDIIAPREYERGYRKLRIKGWALPKSSRSSQAQNDEEDGQEGMDAPDTARDSWMVDHSDEPFNTEQHEDNSEYDERWRSLPIARELEEYNTYTSTDHGGWQPWPGRMEDDIANERDDTPRADHFQPCNHEAMMVQLSEKVQELQSEIAHVKYHLQKTEYEKGRAELEQMKMHKKLLETTSESRTLQVKHLQTLERYRDLITTFELLEKKYQATEEELLSARVQLEELSSGRGRGRGGGGQADQEGTSASSSSRAGKRDKDKDIMK